MMIDVISTDTHWQPGNVAEKSRSIIFKQILVIDILWFTCEIAFRWMP